jgi:hypothetical protein
MEVDVRLRFLEEAMLIPLRFPDREPVPGGLEVSRGEIARRGLACRQRALAVVELGFRGGNVQPEHRGHHNYDDGMQALN